MSVILQNFVTLRATRGDVLNPTQFRTIVEMIQGILRSGDYAAFKQAYKLFLAHLLDFDDPHHDTRTDFLPEIIMRTYAIYTQMTPVPLGFTAFQAQIVPTMGFLELVRRIVLNRLLYRQVKHSDGSVPTSATVYLGEDWGITDLPTPGMTVTFPAGITDETGFIRAGWNGNTTPVPLIFTASQLSQPKAILPIIFETSATVQYLSNDDSGAGYPIALNLTANDLSIVLDMSSVPTAPTQIFAAMTSTDTLEIWMDATKSVQLVHNGAPVTGATVTCDSGHITVILDHNGNAKLRGKHNGVETTVSYPGAFAQITTPFTSALLSVPLSAPTGSDFGIKSCVIYRGDLDGSWSL